MVSLPFRERFQFFCEIWSIDFSLSVWALGIGFKNIYLFRVKKFLFKKCQSIRKVETERQRAHQPITKVSRALPELQLHQTRLGERDSMPIFHVGNKNPNVWAVFHFLSECVSRKLAWTAELRPQASHSKMECGYSKQNYLAWFPDCIQKFCIFGLWFWVYDQIEFYVWNDLKTGVTISPLYVQFF